jgi:hypothetical protein
VSTGVPPGPEGALEALRRSWRPALLAYVGRGDESALVRAYELGRGALAAQVNLVDLLGVHHRLASALVLEVVVPQPLDGADLGTLLDRCAAFLQESVTPYAMAQLAYRELSTGPGAPAP